MKFVYPTHSSSGFYVHCVLKQERYGIEVQVLIIFLMASEIFMLLDLFSFARRPFEDTPKLSEWFY